MRYLELLLTDVADRPDTAIRREWIHRDHIESIEPYLEPASRQQPMLWLELTLTSGRTRYIPIRPVHPRDADDIARTAITALLEQGVHPVHAVVLPGPGTPDRAAPPRS